MKDWTTMLILFVAGVFFLWKTTWCAGYCFDRQRAFSFRGDDGSAGVLQHWYSGY